MPLAVGLTAPNHPITSDPGIFGINALGHVRRLPPSEERSRCLIFVTHKLGGGR